MGCENHGSFGLKTSFVLVPGASCRISFSSSRPCRLMAACYRAVKETEQSTVSHGL